jgi:hypothetical protein
MVNTGMYKIPEIQKQYAKIKDELEAIDYKKTMAKYQLNNMNNQITYLNKISYSKRNEIAYLKIGLQELEGYAHGLIVTANNNKNSMKPIAECASNKKQERLQHEEYILG